MIDIESFRSAAVSLRDDAQVTLTADRRGVAARTGRIARWIGNFRTGANRDTAARFLESLTARYGGDLSDQALESSGAIRAIKGGKPLRARHVREAVRHADRLQAAFRNRNAGAADAYLGRVATGVDLTLLQVMIDDAARTLYPGISEGARLVDAAALEPGVRQAIAAAGNDGSRLVTTELAAMIVKPLVHEAVNAALSPMAKAVEQVSIDRPHTLAARALAQIGMHAPGLGAFSPERLTPDARHDLQQRLLHRVRYGLSQRELEDEVAVGAVAERVIGDFARERAAAARAVRALPIDEPIRAKLLEQVLHDNVPADMVPGMWQAYTEVREHIPALGEPAEAPELQKLLPAFHGAMRRTFAATGRQLGAPDESSLVRGFWRFLLTPGGGHGAIAERLAQPDGALRAVSEGANWYCSEFPDTPMAQRTLVSGDPDLHGTPIFGPDSFGHAGEYSAMLTSLAGVVSAQGGDAPLRPRWSSLSDESIATLRNLGIPMPAPERMGHANRLDSLCEPAVSFVREELAIQMRKKRDATLKDGVLEDAIVDYNRATYQIEGRTLERARGAVIDGLQNLCRDRHGVIDEQLLKSVSTLAYQAAPICGRIGAFNVQRPDLAVSSSDPSHQTGTNRVTYNLSRDDGGDVLLRVVDTGRLGGASVFKPGGGFDGVNLDAERSHLYVTMEIRFDAESCEPTLEHLDVDYALFEKSE